MTFVDEVQDYLNKYPHDPSGAVSALDCTVAHLEHHDETRWTQVYHLVLQKENEWALIEYHEGSTEYQDDVHDEYPPECFAVEPYVTEVVRYRPV